MENLTTTSAMQTTKTPTTTLQALTKKHHRPEWSLKDALVDMGWIEEDGYIPLRIDKYMYRDNDGSLLFTEDGVIAFEKAYYKAFGSSPDMTLTPELEEKRNQFLIERISRFQSKSLDHYGEPGHFNVLATPDYQERLIEFIPGTVEEERYQVLFPNPEKESNPEATYSYFQVLWEDDKTMVHFKF